jgi:hypothetical protein
MSNEDLKLAKTVIYDSNAKEVIVTLKDGSRHAWPVRLLEMVQSEPDAWVSIKNITDQQLADVEVYGGGRYILWDELGQSFSIADLLAGIYGREAWMQGLMATSE